MSNVPTAQRSHGAHRPVDDVTGRSTISNLPGRPYDSANYRWFAARYDDFLYLDRVAVGERHRRRGVGGAIYEEMELRARPSGRMLCEVNLEPPNHPSLAFHSARGSVSPARLTPSSCGAWGG